MRHQLVLQLVYQIRSNLSEVKHAPRHLTEFPNDLHQTVCSMNLIHTGPKNINNQNWNYFCFYFHQYLDLDGSKYLDIELSTLQCLAKIKSAMDHLLGSKLPHRYTMPINIISNFHFPSLQLKSLLQQ